jgi:hypothetical protein
MIEKPIKNDELEQGLDLVEMDLQKLLDKIHMIPRELEMVGTLMEVEVVDTRNRMMNLRSFI